VREFFEQLMERAFNSHMLWVWWWWLSGWAGLFVLLELFLSRSSSGGLGPPEVRAYKRICESLRLHVVGGLIVGVIQFYRWEGRTTRPMDCWPVVLAYLFVVGVDMYLNARVFNKHLQFYRRRKAT